MKAERKCLTPLSGRDSLTGLYNRAATIEKINELLKERQLGILFVIDIDDFKAINNRYGHVASDCILQEVASILKKMTFCHDILGRIGGDMFVIFMPISQGDDYITSRCRQIEQRFLSLSQSRRMGNKLSLTVCGSSYQPGDQYDSLLDRTYKKLLTVKGNRIRRKEPVSARKACYGLKKDMENIGRELSEDGAVKGAYYQDYEHFISIYRFMVRHMKRKPSGISCLLITLTDEQEDLSCPGDREQVMETLYQVILHSLRMGDVFTRYSSCQYLLMLPGLPDLKTEIVAERIREKFYGHKIPEQGYQLIYSTILQGPPPSVKMDLYKNARKSEPVSQTG